MTLRPSLLAAVLAAGSVAAGAAPAVAAEAAPASATAPADLRTLEARTVETPSDGPAWYALARALQDAGRHEEAIGAFDRAIALKHFTAAAQLRAAQSAHALQRTDEALARVERAAAAPGMFLGSLAAIGTLSGLEQHPRFVAARERALAARYPCRAEGRHREFDFWLGSWDVSVGGRPPQGRSTITADLAGCVVREHWKTPAEEGTSVNFYDPHSGLWHQVWTADNGTVTHYQGGFRDGAMRFEAQGFGDADGVTRQRRLSFVPEADGSVRQRFEESTDGGATWTTTFDGHYTRRRE